MSVIFETLQKLNRPVVETDAEERADRSRGNVYALKTVLLSPVTVLVLALVVFGLGYGLVYGLRQVQRSARMDPAVVAAAQQPVTGPESTVTTVPVTQPAQEVPPPPDVRHLETAASADSPTVGQPVYAGPAVSPPSAEAMGALDNEILSDGQAGAWTPPISNSSQSAPLLGMGYAAGSVVVDQNRYAGFTPAAYSPATDAPRLSNAEGPPRVGAAAPSAGGEESAVLLSQPASVALHDGPTNYGVSGENDAHAGWTLPAEAVSAEANSLASADSETAAERPRKRIPIPRYTRLVNRLQTAIVTGDTATTEQLLDDLAAVKGKQHPYIIKLKAFRHLQAKEYPAAEVLLGQVLALDKDDRDALMNMAVVEANTGRLDAARRRVASLTERFPDDEALAAMGRQLHR